MSRILPTPLMFKSGYANTENVFYCLNINIAQTYCENNLLKVSVLSDLNLVSVLCDRNLNLCTQPFRYFNLLIDLCFQSTNLKFLAWICICIRLHNNREQRSNLKTPKINPSICILPAHVFTPNHITHLATLLYLLTNHIAYQGFWIFKWLRTTLPWLWRWLPDRLSKRQSLTTVLRRTPISQMRFFN